MVEEQKQICEQFQSKFSPVADTDLIAFAGKDFDTRPIIGCRIEDWDELGKPIGRWYISCGELQEQEEEQWFSVFEISQKLPEIVPFLALEQGFNFIIDEENDADVWFDN